MNRSGLTSMVAGTICFLAVARAATAADGGNGNGKVDKPQFKTKVVKGTPEQVAQAAKIAHSLPALRDANLTHSTQGLQAIQRADGSMGMALDGRFLDEMVAVRNADGTLSIRCGSDKAPSAPKAEEK